jgi:hypothetical protein
MVTKEFHEPMKRLLVVASLIGEAGAVCADPQRSLLTYENKMPDYHQAEVGVLLNGSGYDAYDTQSVDAYARFGLITNVTLDVDVPYMSIDRDVGGSDSGIGDVEVGLALRACEDIFGYPFCIPHISATVPTGNEDKGLGYEDSVIRVGVSVGTVTYDVLHWLLDVSYVANGTKGPNPDDIMMISGGLVWDVSPKFSVLAEARATDEDTTTGDDVTFIQGGMTYKFTPHFVLGWYAGAGNGGPDNEENSATAKASTTS